jgi:hypothetical protein
MPSDVKKMHFFRYSELAFWSHTGLNLAHGMVATLPGHYACADTAPCVFNSMFLACTCSCLRRCVEGTKQGCEERFIGP